MDEVPLVNATWPVETPEPPSSPGSGFKIGCISAIVSLLVASIVGITAGFAGGWWAASYTGGGQQTVTVIEGETEEVVAAAAAVALPSVVNIDIAGATGADEDGELPEGHPGVPVFGNASGVAFLEAPDGGTYILTNHHVIDGADDIVVTDITGDRYSADVIGTDENTDIGVIYVDAIIPTIELGDSDPLVPGQLVVAIGSPFGLAQSVSSGVVSALNRSLPQSTDSEGVYPLVDVIQTDAAINPGNSGGALVDRMGRLVGINTAIYSNDGANAGIGFAVPEAVAIRVAEEIIATGSAQAPFLGIIGQTVTSTLAEEEGLPVDEGALVIEVTAGTKAADAGLAPDDLIVGYGDSVIRSMDDLILEVRRTAVGDEVALSLYRDGELIDVRIEVGAKPDEL